ncbi:ubiquitin carboxyl-terminal hydrolase 2-like [Odontesthes bonariensis]|uniref:ubiquitin carboxyl-terminal hydrolase 2-like n=1 Tax=Odontesthes bonariensis TaxID=219752 RepID=UPI003F5874A0
MPRSSPLSYMDEQSEAAECFENILRNVSTPGASQLFQGQLTHKSRCSTCGTETSTDDPFWSLPLELVGSDRDYKVVDGVADFFRESHVSGPNQLFCDRCDAKSDATMKFEIKHQPEVLMLMLKRFKFDYGYMNYVKMNHSVRIPYKLQIPPSGAQSQTYELYAFVEHVGELKCGRYTVTIRSQDDEKWYHFNDSEVRLLSFQPFQLDITERSRDAYLLFYRKVAAAETSSTSEAFKEDTRDKNKQRDHDAKTTGNKAVEGAAAGSQDKMDRRETEKKRRVNDRGDRGGGNSLAKQGDEKIMTEWKSECQPSSEGRPDIP